MSFFHVSIILFQVALPIGLVAWLGAAPARSLLLYIEQVAVIGLYLAALCLVPVWLVPPWWVPWVYVAAGVAVLGRQFLAGRIPVLPVAPKGRAARAAAATLALLVAGLSLLVYQALAGRAVPGNAVDVAFPLGPGTYLAANGGATQTVNAHFLTLRPSTDRQRDYRGQSHAVDLVKIDRYGFRADGLRPRDPADYRIFGEAVYAPCAGEVLAAADDMPDMPVPEMDTSRLEGNHVFIDCGEFGVLLAHLKKDSVRVENGQRVDVGTPLGVVGNSGQSAEPHLHIHAQRIPGEGPLLAGEPLFMTFDGRFPVRNDRLRGERSP